MDFKEYQEAQQSTAIYSSPMYPFGSLAEEAGEVLGKLNKFSRKHDLSYEESVEYARVPSFAASRALRDDLLAELGDVLWQLSACAGELGMTLEEVAQANIDKLAGRVQRGTLDGSGDNR